MDQPMSLTHALNDSPTSLWLCWQLSNSLTTAFTVDEQFIVWSKLNVGSLACFSTYFVKNTKLLGPLCPWRCFAINQTKQVFFMTEDIEICSMPRVTFAKVLNLFRRLLHHTLWDFYSGEWKVITNLPTAQDLDELMTIIIMRAKIIINENIVQNPADMNISQGWNMSRAQYLRLYRCHVWVGRCHKWKTCLFEIFFSFAAQFQTECFELL